MVQFSHYKSSTINGQPGEHYGIEEDLTVTPISPTTRYSVRAVDVLFLTPGPSGKPIIYVKIEGLVNAKGGVLKDISAAVREEPTIKALQREITKDALKRHGLRVKDVEIL